MSGVALDRFRATVDEIRSAGLYKSERVLTGPQAEHVRLAAGQEVLNLCSNNYLGLANDERVIEAAVSALGRFGHGMASVRFICGTQEIHKDLEERIAGFLGADDSILYSSCFDANAGLFETLLDEQDAIISDELNHASIIDGIRLSKAQRYRYRNRDMADLEVQLRAASAARLRVIATDGVFSMDGYIAPIDQICKLAERHDALVMVDDSHAVGFIGPNGRGTPDLHGVTDQVDIITGTFGKALGGASGGYVAGRTEIVELLRQRSRPYLFSNSLPPAIAAAAIEALNIGSSASDLRDKLRDNTSLFRQRMAELDFEILPGEHPIVPVMIGDAPKAARMADLLLNKGVYVIAFSYPVVPMGTARIRAQVSAAHSAEDLETAAEAFAAARVELE